MGDEHAALQPHEGSSGTRENRVSQSSSVHASTSRGFVWNRSISSRTASCWMLQPHEGSSGTSSSTLGSPRATASTSRGFVWNLKSGATLWSRPPLQPHEGSSGTTIQPVHLRPS